ncbi:MAG: DNA polymerase III subunit delta [Verrucomicrobia bacterium]|nr:DNA polymerase III subunit delta [Verrucomicrobiota bacterium]
MAQAPFDFICGADDFLVQRAARERWQAMCAEISDSFNCEEIDGQASVIAEVETAVNRFASAVQTLPMFGGKKAVWFKNINFMNDSGVGRFESSQEQVERLQGILENLNPDEVSVLISASPVDRRKRSFKWLQTNSHYRFFENPKDEAAVVPVLESAAEEGGHPLQKGVAQAIWSKLNGNLRLALNEIQKLCTYLHDEPGSAITEEHVLTLVPHFGEGDFFEAVEAFYALDLEWTLQAIHRHFFAGHNIRPMIAAFQGRNRLCLQLKVLQENGDISHSLNAAALTSIGARHGHLWLGSTEKSGFNVLTQHPFYLSRLLRPLPKLTLKQLIQFQLEFVQAFQASISRPNEEEAIMRETVIRCLQR